MYEVLLAVIFILTFLCVHFHICLQEEKRWRKYYEHWNKIHTDTLFLLTRGGKKNDK